MHALEKDPTVRYQTMLEFAQAISASTDAAALGYRPALATTGEHSMSFLPHAPGTPTHQQFVPSTTPVAPVSARTGEPGQLKSTDAARAETLIGAEANARPHAPRARGALLAALVALVAFGGVGAWFVTHRGGSTTPTPETPSALAAIPLAPPASAVPLASSAPAPSVEATVTPSIGIRLDVSSQPSGAILLKNGFQVCDATPCEGTGHARRNARVSSAQRLAQGDRQGTRSARPKGHHPPAAAGAAPKPAAQRLCEVEVDGLKILRACK